VQLRPVTWQMAEETPESLALETGCRGACNGV